MARRRRDFAIAGQPGRFVTNAHPGVAISPAPSIRGQRTHLSGAVPRRVANPALATWRVAGAKTVRAVVRTGAYRTDRQGGDAGVGHRIAKPAPALGRRGTRSTVRRPRYARARVAAVASVAIAFSLEARAGGWESYAPPVDAERSGLASRTPQAALCSRDARSSHGPRGPTHPRIQRGAVADAHKPVRPRKAKRA